MDDQRLDLSALDPMREPERWRAVVDGTRARVDAVLDERRARRDPFAAIEAWARPLLAAAAVAAALLGPSVRASVDGGAAGLPAGPGERTLAAHTLEWVRTGRAPTGTDLLDAVARSDARGGTP